MRLPKFLKPHKADVYVKSYHDDYYNSITNRLHLWYYWLSQRNSNNHPTRLTLIGKPSHTLYSNDSLFFIQHDMWNDVFPKSPVENCFLKTLNFRTSINRLGFNGQYLLHQCKNYTKKTLFRKYECFEFGFCGYSELNNNSLVCKNCTYPIPPGYTLQLLWEDQLNLDLIPLTHGQSWASSSLEMLRRFAFAQNGTLLVSKS